MNIQDQITHFEKLCASTFDKEKKPQGIAMPKQIASALPLLEFGKRYLFGFDSQFRDFILWHLAKSKQQIIVTSYRNQFELDFYALLERESAVGSFKIRAGLLSNKQQVALLEALERMRGWKVEWTSAAAIYSEKENPVLVITLHKQDWQTEWETISRKFLSDYPQAVVLGFLAEGPTEDKRGTDIFYREDPSFPEKRADVFCCCRHSTLSYFSDGDVPEGPCKEESIICLYVQDNTKLANAGVNIPIKDLLGR